MFKKLRVISVKKTSRPRGPGSTGQVRLQSLPVFPSHSPVPQQVRLGLPIGALAILAVSSRHPLLALVSSVKPSKQNTKTYKIDSSRSQFVLQNRFQRICMAPKRCHACPMAKRLRFKTTVPFATKTIESTSWNDSPRRDNDSLDCQLLNFSSLYLCMLFNHFNHFCAAEGPPHAHREACSRVTGAFGRQLTHSKTFSNVIICNVVLM